MDTSTLTYASLFVSTLGSQKSWAMDVVICDTTIMNPAKEDTEYVDSILNDIRWLGFDPGENIFFASDYFEQLYLWAEELVENGKAYVCSLNDQEVREYRGTVMEPAPSPDRKIVRWRKVWNCCVACVLESSQMGNTRCGPKSTWPIPT